MDNSNPYASPRSDVTRPAPTAVDTTGPFDPKGRFTRLSLLAWNLVLMVVANIVSLLLMAVGLVTLPGPNSDPTAAIPLVGLIVMAIGYLIIVVLAWIPMIRRFHDIDASGWWSATLFVPVLNLITVLVLLFKRGDDSANRFGPPRPTPTWEQVLGIIYIVLMVLGIVGVIAAIAIPSYQMHAMQG